MKNLAVILAISTVAFTMPSCQKEDLAPVENPTPQASVQALSATETWILLEQNWSVTITQSSPATVTAKTASGTQLNGSAIASSALPQAVVDVMNGLGVAIPTGAVCWSLAGGGYVLQIPTAGFPMRVFWFNASNKIKSIGQVQP